MNKKDLYLRFAGLETEELEKRLAQYNEAVAQMILVDDLDVILESKEVVEEILKERAGGAK